MIRKIALAAVLTACFLSLQACSSFGGTDKPTQAELQKMTPAQRQAALQKYNQEQTQKSNDDSLLSDVAAVAGAVSDSGVVKPHQDSHCQTTTSKPVCHQNADGSETCTQSSSGNCSSFGVD